MAVIIIRGRSVDVSKDHRSLLEPKPTTISGDHQQMVAVTAGDKAEKRELAPRLNHPNG